MCRVQREKTWYAGQRGCILRSCQGQNGNPGLMEDLQSASETMSEIAALGVELVIDDFGTGYSSLNYLRCLPLQALKIDRSFLSSLDSSESATAEILKALVGLAQRLQVKVIAEGVETEEQLAFLRQILCTEAQGYLIGRPTSARDLASLLNSQKSKVSAPGHNLRAADGSAGGWCITHRATKVVPDKARTNGRVQ